MIDNEHTIHFPEKETPITIAGPVGPLEALVQGPAEAKHIKAVGVVCHPHPLFSGTMHNKVVTTIARSFRHLELATIRFNYRGVGNSVGHYADGIGETEDLLAVLQWLKEACPDGEVWLAGFSFGAYVAMRAVQVTQITKLVLVAPPVNHFPFIDISQQVKQCVVVQGENDEIVPAEEVLSWYKSLKKTPDLIYMPDTSHFFHSKLGELRHELEQVLR